ncbi:MAG: hypothetical protein AAGB93_24880 [Planctomycetota bacterium]
MTPARSDRAPWFRGLCWIDAVAVLALGVSPAVAISLTPALSSQARAGGEVWSCQRPILADVDGDGIEDFVGEVVRYGARTTHAAAFSGKDGALLWISENLRRIGKTEASLGLSVEGAYVRARKGDDDTWLRLLDGEPTEAPKNAKPHPDRSKTTGWPFPRVRWIQHSVEYAVERGRIRAKRTADFEGFEREQEIFPKESPVHASFGELTAPGGIPALVGFRPGDRRRADEEVWRVVLGSDADERSYGLPSFTAIDADAESVVAFYRRGKGVIGNLRASLVDLRTGDVTWDVSVPGAGPFMSVTLDGDRVVVSTLGGLTVLDRDEGTVRMKIAQARR